MNINRNNYEEFFMLYLDGELSDAEKALVDAFISENSDLLIEFNQLQLTKLPLVDVSIDKSALHKLPADYTPSDERMLYYIDDEMTAQEKIAFEIFLLSHPELKSELEILQKAKLDPKNELLFENRKILYRRGNSRIVTMHIVRIAAAAVLVFFLIAVGWLYLNKLTVSDTAQIKNESKINQPEIVHHDQRQGSDQNHGKDVSNSMVAVDHNQEEHHINNSETGSSRSALFDKGNAVNSTNPIAQQQLANADVKVNENGNTHHNENNFSTGSNINGSLSVLPVTKHQMVVEKEKENILANRVVNVKHKQLNPAAQMGNIPEIQSVEMAKASSRFGEESDNVNTVFYIPEENITRTRVGGFFKKIKRIVERTADIEVPNGIKVAGFQIALK